MDNIIDRTGQEPAFEPMSEPCLNEDQASDELDLICLPAIGAKEQKSKTPPPSSQKRPALTKKTMLSKKREKQKHTKALSALRTRVPLTVCPNITPRQMACANCYRQLIPMTLSVAPNALPQKQALKPSLKQTSLRMPCTSPIQGPAFPAHQTYPSAQPAGGSTSLA